MTRIPVRNANRRKLRSHIETARRSPFKNNSVAIDRFILISKDRRDSIVFASDLPIRAHTASTSSTFRSTLRFYPFSLGEELLCEETFGSVQNYRKKVKKVDACASVSRTIESPSILKRRFLEHRVREDSQKKKRMACRIYPRIYIIRLHLSRRLY